MVDWLFGFYGISTFVGCLMPNPFYTNDQFYFKQFSLAWVHISIVKTFLFQAIYFSQKVPIQPLQFCVSTFSMSKTVPNQTIQFSISMQFSSTWTVD